MKKVLLLTVALLALAGSVNADCGVMTCENTGTQHGLCTGGGNAEDQLEALQDMSDIYCGAPGLGSFK